MKDADYADDQALHVNANAQAKSLRQLAAGGIGLLVNEKKKRSWVINKKEPFLL